MAKILQWWRDESASSVDEYRELAKWMGPVVILLWPAFGWIWPAVMGLPERMDLRLWIAAGYSVMVFRGWTGKFNKVDVIWWVSLHGVALVWFPWTMYLYTGRSLIWVASLVFFALGLGMMVRFIHMFAALALGGGLFFFENQDRLRATDLSVLIISSTSLLIATMGLMVLRSLRVRVQRQKQLIQEVNEKLKAADRRKDEFTAAVAHDLRTPLAVCWSIGQELLQGATPDSHGEAQLRSMMDALANLKRQTEELLDLERFSLGVAKIAAVESDAAQFCLRFEAGFAAVARSRRITFQVVTQAKNILANFDLVRMETVLFNLISNAFKFTQPGGHVELQVKREEDDLIFAVLDDGEGIPLAQQSRIWERYQQVDRGPSTYTSGVGIGLSLVKEIVDAHGGIIRLESTPGMGSLFEVRLKNACAGMIAPQGLPELVEVEILTSIGDTTDFANQEATNGLHGDRVLVVEDNPMLRSVLSELLGVKWDVRSAGEGREGLRKARLLHPAAIVSDFWMPGMNGLELLQEIRSEATTRDIPVILLSASTELQDAIPADGLTRVMAKPFDNRTLLRTLDDMVRVAQAARALRDSDSSSKAATAASPI